MGINLCWALLGLICSARINSTPGYGLCQILPKIISKKEHWRTDECDEKLKKSKSRRAESSGGRHASADSSVNMAAIPTVNVQAPQLLMCCLNRP
ncbi:hypothetical protein Tco_0648897 [Tanacetum coccineum]